MRKIPFRVLSPKTRRATYLADHARRFLALGLRRMAVDFWKKVVYISYPPYRGGGLIYSFEVDNVDEEYEKLKTSDLLILLHVKTEEWGQRHFMIKDPSGMVIDVVQHTEPTDAYKDQYAG